MTTVFKRVLSLVNRRDDDFIIYCEELIARDQKQGKNRRAEKLRTSLNSLKHHTGRTALTFAEVTVEEMKAYEDKMIGCGLSVNTRSFYFRTLRAAYNRAVDEGKTPQQLPFRKVYTGIAKTKKRALSFNDIKRIKDLDLKSRPTHAFARDVFVLILLMRGISIVDLAYLKKSDLRFGVIRYHRHKTGQLISIKWEAPMRQLAHQLWAASKHKEADSPYLLPLIADSGKDPRRQYLNMSHLINKKLHQIGEELHLPLVLTTYVARHSWASIARSRHIPISVISEALGHDNEATTQIYLSSLDTSIIDAANRKVWAGL